MKSFYGLIAALLLVGCGGGGSSSDASSPSASGEGVLPRYAVQGSINVHRQMVLDGDTNDPNNTYINNNGDTFEHTQGLSSPVTVGGYLGRRESFSEVDLDDVYKVELLKGQLITLVVSDKDANDFDLYLYDSNGSMLSNSQGIDTYEVLKAPEDGTYYVDVYGYSVEFEGDSGGIYNLMIGQGSPAASSTSQRETQLSDRFPMMQDEVLFVQKPAAARSGEDWRVSLEKAEIHIQSAVNANGVTKVLLDTPLRAAVRGKTLFEHPVSGTIRAVKMLRRRSDIVYAAPNYIRSAYTVPNDLYYPLQWHYPQINLPAAWDITTGSEDVIVAVIDTGVVLTHPDLSSRLIGGYDFVSDLQNSNDGDGIDSDPNDPGDGNTVQESSFHGTHVAGTIAAATNNGIGVAGVAWKSKIMPVRVLGKLGGSDYDIAQGIRYAAALPNDSGTVPPKRADIINMSLGGTGYAQVLDDAVKDAQAAGVIVVAAAGNDNTDAADYYPAGLQNVITVSAVDYSSERAPYSNYGSTVDVAAPGGNIGKDANGDGYADGVLSTVMGDSYRFYEGTSMATPHVAGVIALMKAVYPGLTLADLQRLLAHNHPNTTQAITVDKGVPGRDGYFGYGLINALGAVNAAQELANSAAASLPVLSALPESFTFNDTAAEGTLYLDNAGNGDLVIDAVYSTQSWLSVSKTSEGEYHVQIDTSSLSGGVYSAKIIVESNGGETGVPVLATITQDEQTQGEVGEVYILLVDPYTLETMAATSTSRSEHYAYRLSDVPAGDYYLVAGTDVNNDDYIDNNGEAKGVYPALSQPKVISISADRSNLDVTLSYQTTLQTGAATAFSNSGGADTNTLHFRREVQ